MTSKHTHHHFHVRHHNVNSWRGGFSCIEVIAAIVAVFVPFLLFIVVGQRHGAVSGLAAGAVAGVLCCLLVRSFYLWSARLIENEMRALDTQYPSVYRVLRFPANAPCVKAEGVEVLPGDYGWEAEPFFKDDGLIYLQGLTQEWRVAWYAGFEAPHIERICQKPRSQYYLPYTWICAGAQPPPCPYPVGQSPANDLGFPERTYFPYIQGIRFDARRDHA